jgi:hypothetical protein
MNPRMTAIDITTDRYLRSLSEVVAADSMAALVTRGDIVRLTERQGVMVVVAAQAAELGSTARRCAQVRAALVLPDEAAAEELAALRGPSAARREPQP